MKKIGYYFAVMGLLLQGCEKDDLCNCMKNSGSTTTETRNMADFNTLEMNNNVDIILLPDTMNYVEITCGSNLMDGIKTEVVNGILVVSNINKCNWLRDFKNKFTAKIHFKTISQIYYYGSGNLTCSDTLRQNYLQVESKNGTGELSFLLNCGEVYLKLHTGPGDITAVGKAGIVYLYSAGNGFMKTAGLEAQYVYVTTKSTGDCEVNSQTELGVNIDYNGDVYYKGSPSIITQAITGTGKLIPF